jgi:hypothetical protein
MSERIYALLFRLFPARFRARWHDDALELYRDRARNEQGLIPRLRLWLDLLADLASSLPRAYLSEDPALVPSAQAPRDTIPSFTILEDKPIRSSSFFFGTLLSLTVLTGVATLARHGGHFPILRAGSASESGGVTVDPWATGRASGNDGGGSTEVIGDGPASTSTTTSARKAATSVIQLASKPRTRFFDSAERQRVVQGVVANLNQHYFDPAEARTIGQTLQSNERSGKYDSVDDPDAFASLLTSQLRATSHDTHFEVIFSPQALHEYQPPSAAQSAAYRAVLLQANCTFDKVAILPHNIGYLKLDTFPDLAVCGDTAIAAMKTLSRADALIIDLRDNSGGSPDMVMFLANWLFDRPAFFYNPREDSAARMWTNSPTAGSRLADKPVWVLTSSRTYSYAEHFSYNLKMLHRATLVGETTAGATDVGAFHRIDDHFGIGLRESKVPNPYPQPDWAVNGVQPDIRVPAAEALDTAEKLALTKLSRP